MLPKKAKDCYNAKSYPLLEPSSSSSSSSTKCLTKRKYHSTDFTNYFNISLIVIFLIALLTLDTVSSLTCKVNQYPCADGNQCVVETYLCDNEKDCEDGSDETRCSPPSFVYANFGDRFIRKGENISLSCRAVGFPTPLIRWKFNDHFITSNHSRYRNTSINGHGKLTITGVRKEDEGIYKCVAENANNSIHSNSTIKLQVSLARDSAGEKKTSRDEPYSRYREDGAIIRGLPDPLTGSVPSEDAIFLRQIANNYSAPLVASYLHSRLQKTIRMIEEIRYSLKNLSTTRRLLYIMKVRQLEALDKQITSLQKIGHFNENTPIQYLIEKYILMNELIPIEFGLEEARFNSTPDDLLKQVNLISNDILIKYVSDLIKVYLRDIEVKESNGKYNELQRFTALLTKRKLEPLINLQYFWPSEHVDHDGQRIGTFDDRLPQIEFVLRQLNNTLDVFYTQFESLASQSATSPCRMNEQTTIMN